MDKKQSVIYVEQKRSLVRQTTKSA